MTSVDLQQQTLISRHCFALFADCAPGFYLNGTLSSGGWCVACPVGSYCPGFDSSITPNPNNQAISCASGLQTTITGAKSNAQVTKAACLHT